VSVTLGVIRQLAFLSQQVADQVACTFGVFHNTLQTPYTRTGLTHQVSKIALF